MQRARDAARRIFEAGVRAADPYACVEKSIVFNPHTLELVLGPPSSPASCSSIPLSAVSEILLVGAGKGACPMCAAAGGILSSAAEAAGIPFSGVAVTKTGHFAGTSWEADPGLVGVDVTEASHPVLDESSLAAGRAAKSALAAASSSALIVCLLSGGASSLLEAPVEGISLDHLQASSAALLACGASIDELNAVRSRLSSVKGGKLASSIVADNIQLYTLALSDVVGDSLAVIGSGPTYIPPEGGHNTVSAWGVVEKYALHDVLPQQVVDLLAEEEEEDGNGQEGNGPAKTGAWVVGSNSLALEAAAEEAAALGYAPLILSSTVEGEAADVAKVFASIGKEMVLKNRPIPPPAVVLAGGETTVTLGPEFDPETSSGGRNQELALAAALVLDDPDLASPSAPPLVLLAGGTDGTDGPTDAAGGIVDPHTVSAGNARLGEGAARAHLRSHNAYAYLEAADCLLKTGPTGTNVMDLTLVVVGVPPES